ncbi:glycosyltransferase family 2 protein [Alteribacillus bidgolensis]|uniref:Glycosyltransferase, GT2 family n=1 Tax=Alteribacillus bidgolensis TaxID=930129 RepID=A0A1G8I3M5_9BACI|nr:glycosyltransferase [Alteribacillus bidgolensis]SDI13351.1 Glycosyltransferase, GT2 family [Alteribacillus bidgolensis]
MKSASPEVSIIFPAKNEGDNVKKTLDSLFVTHSNYHYEVIVVDDGSNDGCCNFIKTYSKRNHIKLIRTEGIGAANARNLGAKNAKGKYFAFCDAHLFFKDYWIDKLLKPLRDGKTDAICPAIADVNNPSSIGYGQSLKSNLGVYWKGKCQNISDTAILPGGCFIISQSIFNNVGGFDTGFKRWGFEDIELSIKLWLFGYRCSVLPSVTILHLFRQSHPYQLSSHHINYNLLRMAYSHFNQSRIKKCKNLIKKEDPKKVEKYVLKDGVLHQRNAYIKRRKHDDTWYFNRFSISF